MWYPEAGALRAGTVGGTQWDAANIGIWSIALGHDAEASGEHAIALGYASHARGAGSLAAGQNTVAGGDNAVALGFNTGATGAASTALGKVTSATGVAATAAGYGTEASAYGELAAGLFNTTPAGVSPTAWVATDRLFTIGNGTNALSRSDALVVLKNGNTGIGVAGPTERLSVAGTVSATAFVGDGSGLTNIPQGDITGVTAGTGLTGGGTTGDVTLQVAAPLALTASTPTGSEATIQGTNNGAGYGVYGWSGSNIGVNGFSSSAPGVQGYSSGSTGVVGLNGGNGNIGGLGSPTEGVYGSSSAGIGVKGTSSSGPGGYFSSTTGYGLIVESGNVGIGTAAPSHLLDLASTGGVFMGLDFGLNNNAGITFSEAGTTRWIFPFFRGWQSDNLIVRDEASNIDVMTFEAGSGQVGIGTNTPGADLDIAGAENDGTTAALRVSSSGQSLLLDGNEIDSDAALSLNVNSGNDVVLTSGFGRVGIGKASPAEALDVNGNVLVSGHLISSSTVAAQVIQSQTTQISRSPKHGNVYLTPAAFVSADPGAKNDGSWLWNDDLFNGTTFQAQLRLPDGATVTRVTTYWYDNSAKTAYFVLDAKVIVSGNPVAEMASVATPWHDTTSRNSIAMSTITSPVIDNANNYYQCFAELPAGGGLDLRFLGVNIEYTDSGAL